MEWLSELYTRVEEQKIKQERTIHSLKQLFKPWPLKETESNNKSQSNITVDGAGQTSDTPGNNLTPELTSAEKESLLLVEKVLSKAQKARNVQKKLEEPEKPRLKASLLAESKHGKTDHAVKNCKSGDSSGCESKENSPRQEKMGSSENCEKNGKTSLTKSAPKLTANSSNSRISSDKVNKTKTNSSSTKSIDKTERARISDRPQSSSSRKKVVPVHANAPFKTNPNLGTSRLQTTYRASTAKTFAKSRGAGNSAKAQSRGGANKVNVSSAASVKSGSGNSQRSSESIMNEEVTSTAGDDNRLVADSNMCDGVISDSDKESVSSNIKETQSKIAEMSITSQCETDNSVQSDKLPVPQPFHDQKGFNLAKDGASLSVPGKLKKLLHHNQKLRQKLNAQTLTKKVDSPPVCEEFPHHFEHVFGNEEEKYIQFQARQARHILHTYTNLSSLLDSLNLGNISVDTHPADIYRCKKMMEYILVTYQETEELLHNVDFGKLTSVATYSGNSEPRLPVSQPDNSHLWYTRLAPPGNVQQYGIQYASYKHLEKYMYIVYQIQLTQLQIDVMDTVARLLIPLLKSLDPSSSEFVHVLRAGYSLLTINTNHMPVVVKDTIQDESVQEQSEDQMG